MDTLSKLLKNKWQYTILWTAIVLILSLLPGNSFPKIGFNFVDLVVHFVMYALMAFLLYYSLYYSIQLRGFNFIFGIWIAMVGFGFLIEILQETVAIKRHFSGYDILFNALGAAFIFILNKIQNKQHETHSKSSRNRISGNM
jgi:VanZ family protein